MLLQTVALKKIPEQSRKDKPIRLYACCSSQHFNTCF